ncbi:hypothetical protein FHX42_005272 [Saccharopolyspora lacisalsi]|uniref:Uncharacterized protein n=1 Tax=Halosaccharopolyspora lacisalsi TaxID=1000566 RepID=A0A839E7H7_9PSEU|nr:hypothetical protein [Halosaccharopolyspora lacisalsi]MBA8827865.1 hypothetical protein [Halosaccharopolyspora lacisalsi]
MTATLIPRPRNVAAGDAEPQEVGVCCTVGRSRTRHATLMVPDEHGRARFIPACGIGVSPRRQADDRVSACWISNVVTCKRSGCSRRMSTTGRAAPRHSSQLQFDFDAVA